MATTREVHRKHGPKMSEAVALVLLDMLNTHLVDEHSMSAISEEDFLDALDTKLAACDDYDWMDEE